MGLSLSDPEYIQEMLYHEGKTTKFYDDYVRDIQDIIKRNARGEYVLRVWTFY